MITNQDRSRWFGASDTAIIMGNWNTATFKKWWLVKLGISSNHFSNAYMRAGNILEIPIIHAIEKQEGRRIKLGKRPVYKIGIRLRANYDGLADTLVEIKTTKHGFAIVPKGYWQQCQVLMYAKKRGLCDLYAYQMERMDYICPWFATIDTKRLTKFQITYNEDFIQNAYLPRLRYLAGCLRKGAFPDAKLFSEIAA